MKYRYLENITKAAKDGELYWSNTYDIGYYPVNINFDEIYDDKYFDKYVGYESTSIGLGINEFRLNLVKQYDVRQLLDFGIGSGQFVKSSLREKRYETLGYDINQTAVGWLRRLSLYANPSDLNRLESITFWDSIEHVKEFWRVLAKVEKYVFVSMPIFRDSPCVLKSKHFRTDEHYWYFTPASFTSVMNDLGFELMYFGRDESVKFGRDGIGTFVFKRYRTV